MEKKYYITTITLLILNLSIIFITNLQLNNKMLFLQQYFNCEEINYIINEDINTEDIKPYLKYKKFNIFKYEQYQAAREKYDFSYIESINFINNPHYYHFYQDPQKALFTDKPYILVNKCYYLSKNYIPDNLINVTEYDIDYIVREGEDIYLKKEVLDNYVLMYNAAKKEDIALMIFSGYRSYQKQIKLYYFTYNQDDTISARPGFSEHQTGYAIDISCSEVGLTELFEHSQSYKWLIKNCHKYGFILRFPRGKEKMTGYSFEPWHFRYVGKIAEKIHSDDITLEEYIFSNLEI